MNFNCNLFLNFYGKMKLAQKRLYDMYTASAKVKAWFRRNFGDDSDLQWRGPDRLELPGAPTSSSAPTGALLIILTTQYVLNP